MSGAATLSNTDANSHFIVSWCIILHPLNIALHANR